MACLATSLESLLPKSALSPLQLGMPLRSFSPIIMEQAQGKKNAVRASVTLRSKGLNNRLGYTHVRPEKVEDEPYIWEA